MGGDGAEQYRYVYRGLLRNVVLSLVFASSAAVATFGAVVARRSVTAVATFAVLAALMLYLAVRAALMRAVVTSRGMRLHGPLWTVFVPWALVAGVTGADSRPDAVLVVRTPVLTLASGRRIRMTMASSYAATAGRAGRTKADRIAAELEALRVARACR